MSPPPEPTAPRRLQATYVLPLRWRKEEPLEEPAEYLRWLARRMEVVVVDGSAPSLFERHRRAWGHDVIHVPPDADLTFAYGKVNGVLTGVRRATHEAVVIADDDVRYDEAGLHRLVSLLKEFDLVRPQNYFDPSPWHARWDTGRTLLNRTVGADWPGTLGVRRSALLAAGGYDGDVLFENLELMRTITAAGGTHAAPLDLYVRRLPPSTAHFWSQRVRQAYDEFARPPLLICELAILPAIAALVARRRFRVLAAGAGAIVGAAEAGRRRAGGTTVFPPTASLLAPAWVCERAVCSWVAVTQRLVLGGVRYGDVVISRAASPRRRIRRRWSAGVGVGPVPGER